MPMSLLSRRIALVLAAVATTGCAVSPLAMRHHTDEVRGQSEDQAGSRDGTELQQWRDACEEDTIWAYRRFLESFPESEFAEEAWHRIIEQTIP